MICPNCKKDVMYTSLDCCGYTPWHIHCNSCHIDIGSNSLIKCLELVEAHSKPNTTIRFYNNNLKFMIEDGVLVVDKEGERNE